MVKGKTCFDTRGNCYIYVSQSLDGRHHIVRPIYEQGFGDEVQECYGDLQVIEEVFANCPVEKKSKEVEKLNQTIEKLNDDINSKRTELSNVSKEYDERLKKFKKYDKLKYLENFLDGKFNYFVVTDCNEFKIHNKAEFETSIEDKKFDSGRFKLLTLFGRTNGDLSWRLSRYSDGSGVEKDIDIFETIEEAKEFVKKELTERVNSDVYNGWKCFSTIKQAKELGIEIKKEWIDYHKNIHITQRDEQIKRLKNQLSLVENEIKFNDEMFFESKEI